MPPRTEPCVGGFCNRAGKGVFHRGHRDKRGEGGRLPNEVIGNGAQERLIEGNMLCPQASPQATSRYPMEIGTTKAQRHEDTKTRRHEEENFVSLWLTTVRAPLVFVRRPVDRHRQEHKNMLCPQATPKRCVLGVIFDNGWFAEDQPSLPLSQLLVDPKTQEPVCDHANGFPLILPGSNYAICMTHCA